MRQPDIQHSDGEMLHSTVIKIGRSAGLCHAKDMEKYGHCSTWQIRDQLRVEGLAGRALDYMPGDLGSIPTSATDLLGDPGQVTSPPSAHFPLPAFGLPCLFKLCALWGRVCPVPSTTGPKSWVGPLRYCHTNSNWSVPSLCTYTQTHLLLFLSLLHSNPRSNIIKFKQQPTCRLYTV